jgi:ATP-dependent Clp protease ATP-binding subunit ClpB
VLTGGDGEEGEIGVLQLSVLDGKLVLDGEAVEDDRAQGFKAPERPPIGVALAPAAGSALH